MLKHLLPRTSEVKEQADETRRNLARLLCYGGHDNRLMEEGEPRVAASSDQNGSTWLPHQSVRQQKVAHPRLCVADNVDDTIYKRVQNG